MQCALLISLFSLSSFSIGVFGDGKASVSVKVGDSVTLHTVTKIQTKDVVQWIFENNSIAMIAHGSPEITTTDQKLKDRLQLDNQTGDLKISNIQSTDYGDYKLSIFSTGTGGTTTKLIFNVIVSADGVKTVSVTEGETVTLPTYYTDIQKDAVIRWRFGEQKYLIAEINRQTGIPTYDDPEEIFRDRLKLDQTGSLTIIHTTKKHSGDYEVEISSRFTVHRTFSMTVEDVESVSVLEGDNVTLRTDLTEIKRDYVTCWTFGDHDELIARLNGTVYKKWNNTDLNHQTGDLTITNIQRDGDYKVKIITRIMILHRKYHVKIDGVKSESVMIGASVTLQTVTEIQRDDLIQWMFRDSVIAEILKADQRFFTYDGPDKRFKHRLDLDHQTGSLIIKDITATDSGDYDLKISSSRFTINRRITVTVTAPGLSSAAVAGIIIVVLLVLVVTAAVVYFLKKKHRPNLRTGNNEENQDKQDTNGRENVKLNEAHEAEKSSN